MRITHETLYTEIMNIKGDTGEIKKENKEQWKEINKNSQEIASQKSIIRVIEVFLTGTILSIVGFFWSNK